jgi:hypothetical protein
MSKEQLKKQQSVLKLATATGDYKSAASIYGYNGINPGRFSLTNHTQNPHNGNHSYNVSFDLAAAKYYNKIAGVEWVKWNQEKARMAAAQLQGERNAREFIAKLPSATAEDKEQLTQVKRRQQQVKNYDASLRQHLAKHQRMAANAPVEKLNFNHQYVLPGSLSHLSQPPQPQISPQTILSSQPSNSPFTIPGTQQGEEASQYWANLYVQGEQQGGLTGVAKQAVAFPMGMLSSLWTKDTALATAFTLGTSGLGALAGAGRLGAASMPTIRAMQIGGAFQSGTSIGQAITGKNMFTGEELSPLDRGFHLTFGALGAGLDLGGAGLTLKNAGQSFPTLTNALVKQAKPKVTFGEINTQAGSIKLGGVPHEPTSVPQPKIEDGVFQTKQAKSQEDVITQEQVNVTGLAREQKRENTIINLLYKVRAGKELPGYKGVKLSRRPTPAELEGLSRKHGVEFAVIYKLGSGKGGRGGQYYLYSGKPRSVEFPASSDSILIYHTHPGGTAYASPTDMELLRILQSIGSPQQSSQIVPVGKDVIRFNKDRSRF